MEKMKLKQRFYTTSEIAEYLNVDRRTLERWRADDDGLPCRVVKKRIYYDLDEVNGWLEERPARKWKSKNPEIFGDLIAECKRENSFDRDICWPEFVDKVRREKQLKLPMRYINGLKRIVEAEHPEIKFKTNKEE